MFAGLGGGDYEFDVLGGFGADVHRVDARRVDDRGCVGGRDFDNPGGRERVGAVRVAVARRVVVDVERRDVGAGTRDVADVARVKTADEAATDQTNAEGHAGTLWAIVDAGADIILGAPRSSNFGTAKSEVIMKIGIFGIGSGICADPAVARQVAQAAEHAGLESVWTGEHVVLPDPQKAPSPAPPLFPMLHPSTVLSYLAAVTERVKLGTGIVLIAQRNPVVLAKEMASLDVLSGGRLILGIGAGYLEPEFRALGIPFADRGARTDEFISAMRVLWRDDEPVFDGRFVGFAGIQSRPRPVQAGGPPIVVGGASDAAIERAVRVGQGWYGFAMDVDAARGVYRPARRRAVALGPRRRTRRTGNQHHAARPGDDGSRRSFC